MARDDDEQIGSGSGTPLGLLSKRRYRGRRLQIEPPKERVEFDPMYPDYRMERVVPSRLDPRFELNPDNPTSVQELMREIRYGPARRM